MLILPAIDLKGGRCVRLLQGVATAETVYSDDPVAMAQNFEAQGAKRLHVVDLDGAFEGKGANREQIAAIVQALPIPVQVGGGVRTREDISQLLELGVASVIIGTMAVKQPEELQQALEEFGGERVILGIDSRNRKVAVEGWQEGTELEDVAFARSWKAHGASRVIFTDIARDGMLTGPNLQALEDMARRSEMRVTASGGVSSLEDLQALKSLEAAGVDQVIVGKAIYEGKISLSEAFQC
ncbi:MAG: 1-(5-phosphoribosyl)-5-[(5-phosphoribosylamino)methylideneamino]imidazole-4-carboxamide isomerase [bacterium]